MNRRYLNTPLNSVENVARREFAWLQSNFVVQMNPPTSLLTVANVEYSGVLPRKCFDTLGVKIVYGVLELYLDRLADL